MAVKDMNIRWESKPASAFKALESEWNKLNLNNNNQPILSFKFIYALLKNFSSNDEYLILAWQGDELVFGAIFEKISNIRWRTFQPSQAPLGCMLCDQKLLNDEICHQIVKLLPDKPILLDLTQIDSAQQPLTVNKNLFTSPYISTGWLEIPQNFSAYFADFSKNTRQNFNKARNRLAKSNVDIKLEIITDKSLMRKFIGIYGDIESSGWKNLAGTAIHRDNLQGQFYNDLLSCFAENEQAQIWCYSFNNEIVAVDLCILMNDTLVILKTTFKEEHAKFSPSLLMKLDAYKKLGQEGNIKIIEYFGKTKDWHRRLQCQERDIYHITWCKYPSLFRLFNWIKKFKV